MFKLIWIEVLLLPLFISVAVCCCQNIPLGENRPSANVMIIYILVTWNINGIFIFLITTEHTQRYSPGSIDSLQTTCGKCRVFHKSPTTCRWIVRGIYRLKDAWRSFLIFPELDLTTNFSEMLITDKRSEFEEYVFLFLTKQRFYKVSKAVI